ncbi:MAG TPA: hypothetical protein VGD58_32140 [Herpetosiphonaceae bacterium]
MTSQLFAFRVAKPIETPAEEPVNAVYDPQTQTAVWQGGDRPFAARCTFAGGSYGGSSCNAYGSYCSAPGRGGYYCD